jgi:Holliday junction resolvase-like predicted endonuclease
MSKARYFGHRDQNHKAIAAVFKRLGCSVLEASGQAGGVDLIVSRGDLTALIEIKRREKAITICQIELLANWQGFAAIVCDEETAQKMASDFPAHCLSRRQKETLLHFCAKERLQGATDKKEYSVNKILKLINL